MVIMKRFFKDVPKYFEYAVFSARSDLKNEVASSYLNWLWWILDPLLFMLVYTFIALMVFQKGEEYFPIFVFIGLTLWNFFNKTVIQSVKIMRANSSIVTKVYLPKYILILNKVLVNGFKMLVSFGLIVIMMLIYRVPVSWRVLYIFPIVAVLVLWTFGLSCFMLHFGVFVDDLYNVMQVVLKLLFYLTGIFYDISKRVQEPWNSILLTVNPVSMLIQSARNCLIYEKMPFQKLIVLWGAASLFVCWLGILTIYKYENSYVKVM